MYESVWICCSQAEAAILDKPPHLQTIIFDDLAERSYKIPIPGHKRERERDVYIYIYIMIY